MAWLVLVVLAFQVVPRGHVEIVATAAGAGRAAGGEIKRQGVGRNVNVNVRECAINRGSQVHRGIPGIVDAVSRSDPYIRGGILFASRVEPGRLEKKKISRPSNRIEGR